MSDGIIIGSPQISESLGNYIQKAGKPILQYQEPNHYVDAYSAFYDQIINS